MHAFYLFHMAHPPFLIRRLEAKDDQIMAKIFRDVVVENDGEEFARQVDADPRVSWFSFPLICHTH